MRLLLLLIIYLAFISLGLPDALLGSAWPVMQPDLEAPFELAGYLFMIISASTIVSSLLSGRLLKRFGTGLVTFVSVFMTAAALLGYYFAPSVLWLVAASIPLGLGAGAVDAGLNDYVALHYEAHHMSWLHAFWGVGATLGPIITARFIADETGWRNSYLTIALIQFFLVAVLLFSLPLWQKEKTAGTIKETGKKEDHPIQIPGVKLSMLTFFAYCGIESSVGLWGSSFLVAMKEIDAATAARWISFYYAGITVGRMITGFITFRVSNRHLILAGQIVALSGTLLLLLPLPPVFSLISLMIIGLGLAPIFPSALHETPNRFGKGQSQAIMGYQLAFAYVGTTLVPPLLGRLTTLWSMALFPFWLILLAILMLLSSEKLTQIVNLKNVQEA